MSTLHNGEGQITPSGGKRPFQLEGIEPEPWMTNGLCAQTDPEAFYPEKGGSTREAKSVCAGCPVAAECLDYALAHQERYGIWGGLSERERRRLNKRIQRTNNQQETRSEEPA